VRHIEWFHDHARIERRLFEGALEPRKGRLEPDARRPGLGVRLSRAASEYRLDAR
jgi:L-rhamnonate dehydratase